MNHSCPDCTLLHNTKQPIQIKTNEKIDNRTENMSVFVEFLLIFQLSHKKSFQDALFQMETGKGRRGEKIGSKIVF